MSKNDGGPAFPIPIAGCTDGGVYNTLEQSKGALGGMTLRDYFAAKAMQGLILNEAEDGTIGSDNVEPALAKLSYKIADAMLTERAKDQP